MKTVQNTCACLLAFMLVITPELSRAQDAEKPAIIKVVNDELNAYLKRDKAKWESCWVHSPKAKAVFIGGFYEAFDSYDSIASTLKKHWPTPPVDTKVTKDNFDITIKGDIAIVHLLETWPDRKANQTLIMMKEKKDWRVLEMYSFYKESFAVTETAIEENINSQGYKMLELKKTDDAIKIFALNTELFPNAWNTWDSLAEGYMKKGDKTKAIELYEKSIVINPKNENGKKFLAELKK